MLVTAHGCDSEKYHDSTRLSIYEELFLPRTPNKDPYWYYDSIKGLKAVTVHTVLTAFEASKMFRPNASPSRPPGATKVPREPPSDASEP